METIAIPVVVESDKLGFFQFSQKKFSNSWFESDLEMIRLIGEIIINALIRKESELSILLNETRLLSTLHSIGDAVISTDNDGQVVMMNNMAEMLTGWTWDQAKN
ncbi:MAG: PAS domain-containing protein, partial [Clostridiaceae bacterium]|nr:PAS domain-containing protein [Clostridiaceae bacterium]